MDYIVIAASEVRPGDELVYFENKKKSPKTARARVAEVTTIPAENILGTPEGIRISTHHGWYTVKHPKEGVAVYRAEET